MKLRIYPTKEAVRAILDKKLSYLNKRMEEDNVALEALEASQSVLVTDPFGGKKQALLAHRGLIEEDWHAVIDQLNLLEVHVAPEILVEIEI